MNNPHINYESKEITSFQIMMRIYRKRINDAPDYVGDHDLYEKKESENINESKICHNHKEIC